MRRLLRQAVHAPLHLLPHLVEIGRGLPRRIAHAARGVVELAAHLLELTPDLRHHRLEAALEIADGARVCA